MLDDHRGTREVLAWLLVDLGHWVETVPDAGTALDRLKQDGFDLLLTDVWLPRANGWSLRQLLRERGNLPPYVVSMSTMHVDDVLESSRAVGCFAHLVQPFKIVEIEQLFERVCASSL